MPLQLYMAWTFIHTIIQSPDHILDLGPDPVYSSLVETTRDPYLDMAPLPPIGSLLAGYPLKYTYRE